MGKHTDLLNEIDAKLAEAKRSGAKKKRRAKPATRAAINRANAKHSTGPQSDAGKAQSSANSLRHGFYAHVEKLNPHDASLYVSTLNGLREGLEPDGPAEDHLVRDIAMLSARLARLETAEYALLAGNTEGEYPQIENPQSYTDTELLEMLQPDARATAAAFTQTLDTLERLNKIETHLRRALNRSWDRLERMQRTRRKPPSSLDRTGNSPKRTHQRPTDTPPKENPPSTPEDFEAGSTANPRASTQPELSPAETPLINRRVPIVHPPTDRPTTGSAVDNTPGFLSISTTFPALNA
jgi:hypothetical protein